MHELTATTPTAATSFPTLIAGAGERAAWRFLEFFTVNIRNKNTRAAYGQAAGAFLRWCEDKGITRIENVQPAHVAGYIEELGKLRSAPTVKQHLACIRMLFDWLVTGQVIATNPAHSVRGPRHSVIKGATTVMSSEETSAFLKSIDISHVVGLRDRAILAVMVYGFARVSAVVGLKVEDYFPLKKRWWLRLREKGGKVNEMGCHHKLEQYLDEYIAAAGIAADKKSPLFRAAIGRTGMLSERPMSRVDAWYMVRRRAKDTGLETAIGNHSFRAIGLTDYLENGGDINIAKRMAGHANIKTTELYDRRADEMSFSEIERVGILMPVTDEEDKKFKAYVEEQAKLLKCLDIDKNERVWHYTSGQALLNIVETGTIYASHISCLNDSTELHYGEKLFREAFFELQAKGVSNEIESQYLGRLIKASSEEQAKPKSFTPSDWFVSCFSAEKDDLSQWRAYSGGENGYAIEFLAGGFLYRGSLVAKVNYNQVDHLRVAENLATTTLRFFREGLESRPVAEHENWEKEFWLQWTKSTTQLAPLVKDPAFHGEKEYRIVHLFQAFELSNLKFSQKQSLMAMHLPLVFPPPYATHSKLLPIMEVMVGPSRHKEISRTSVDVLLRKNGYVNIPVSMSAIPFQTT